MYCRGLGKALRTTKLGQGQGPDARWPREVGMSMVGHVRPGLQETGELRPLRWQGMRWILSGDERSHWSNGPKPHSPTTTAAPRVWPSIIFKMTLGLPQGGLGVRGQGGTQKGVLWGHSYWIEWQLQCSWMGNSVWESRGWGSSKKSTDLQGLYCLFSKHGSCSNRRYSDLEVPPCCGSSCPRPGQGRLLGCSANLSLCHVSNYNNSKHLQMLHMYLHTKNLWK